MHTHIHTNTYTCMHACIHTYMHTCIHTYIHTCIHTYIHSYIHTQELLPLTKEGLKIVEQIPGLLEIVQQGEREFFPNTDKVAELLRVCCSFIFITCYSMMNEFIYYLLLCFYSYYSMMNEYLYIICYSVFILISC